MVRKLSVSLDEYSYDLLVAIAEQIDRSLSYTVCVTIQKWADRSLDQKLQASLAKKHGIVDESPKR
jgi:hypothetical protein